MKQILILGLALLSSPQDRALDLKEGDRVLFVGNTFFERDLQHNHLETALTARFAGVTFRNVGWDGDTVWAHARAGFGTEKDGFNHLTKIVGDLKPTVIFVAYGMNESFAGPPGLESFGQGLDRLLDMLSRTQARIILLSPIRHEDLGPPLPDPAAHNKNLQLYGEAIAKTAARRNYGYVDLFPLQGSREEPLTHNGIHLNDRGYRRAAAAIEKAVGLPPRVWKTVADAEKLRAAIAAKNLLYFHYWRPQNDTYIFGFRRKEQGHLVPEFPKFLPLIAEKEAEIARLREAAARTYVEQK